MWFVFFKHLNLTLLYSSYFACLLLNLFSFEALDTCYSVAHTSHTNKFLSAMMEIFVKLPLFPENERENWRGNTCLGHFQTRE